MSAYVFDEAALVRYMGDIYWPEGAHIWLHAPQTCFGGRTAKDMIEAGERERVMQAIDSLRNGVLG